MLPLCCCGTVLFLKINTFEQFFYAIFYVVHKGKRMERNKLSFWIYGFWI